MKILIYCSFFILRYYLYKYQIIDILIENELFNINYNIIGYSDSYNDYFANRQPKHISTPDISVPNRGPLTYKPPVEYDPAWTALKIIWAGSFLMLTYFGITDWYFWHEYYKKFPPTPE